ncbi:metallophosphoesterase [Stieleria varia]|uniref:Calcineurin-like phosphoesterase superfamily domain protein n=1 Tax=Stieleria varia TaxID=2528005 RepID=A0A5C6ATD1_9BACT|nr:metallophosphoesterase [Stieleria varia]TWU02326.1 Calcineurin-like phosphoesterase superfamily domain protein [Stieleria varia]
MSDNDPVRVGRRAFVQDGALLLTAGAVATVSPLYADQSPGRLCVGMITDLHYADKPPAGSRHYRETLAKLDEAAGEFEASKPDFVVELGDLIDAADTVQLEQRYLSTINDRFSKICPDRHYVLGNHCVDTLNKDEFLGGVGQEESFYSFDRSGIHFVVLDSCFRSDGKAYGRKNSKWTDANVPAMELEWLQADLNENKHPVIVFAHQRLDVSGHHSVRNSDEVRKVLESSGRVLAVFQGHSHKNDLQDIAGIHYCTLVAMVEGSGVDNNAYSLMDIHPNGTIRLNGFRHQQSRQWSPQR